MRYLLLVLLCISAVLPLAAQTSRQFTKEELDNPRVNPQFEDIFETAYIPVFSKDSCKGNCVILNMAYAESKISNPQDWNNKLHDKKVVEIGIIFTQFPKNRDFWLTNYHDLLAARLKSVFAIDSNLNNNSIDYKMYLQTNCNTGDEARSMFHGIMIKYVPIVKNTSNSPVKITIVDSARSSSTRIDSFVTAKEGKPSDSVVWQVFKRNGEKWKNMLVVIDWTASMYPFSAQILLWNMYNIKRKDGIKYIVFFNDGAGKPDYKKKIGSTGGVYYTSARDVQHVYDLMKRVTREGDGGDPPENDMEALIKGIARYRNDIKDIVLIADNTSCMRDYGLLYRIRKPVHVVLCRTDCGINPQYVNLAYKTGGSVHTIDQDIQDIVKNMYDGKFTLDKTRFRLTPSGYLKPLDPMKGACPECDYKSKKPKKH